MDTEFLSRTPLFSGISSEDVTALLDCLHARRRAYHREELILHAGDTSRHAAVLLSGAAAIAFDDAWGHRTILDHLDAGKVFAETYACIPGEPLRVSVYALSACEVLFLEAASLLSPCQRHCSGHQQLLRNLLMISARKNLTLSQKIFHTSPKTIRGRLMSYLSEQSALQGSPAFTIPFDRQGLADYLGVDRSALSAELGRLRRDGLVFAQKNRFRLAQPSDPAE